MTLGVSADATRAVFSVQVAGKGEYIFGWKAGGAHAIVGPNQFIRHANLSSNGSKVLYDVDPVGGGANHVGTVAFAGGAMVDVASSVPTDSPDRWQLTADGSSLLQGTTGLLYASSGASVLALSVATFANTRLVNDGLVHPTMNTRRHPVPLLHVRPEPPSTAGHHEHHQLGRPGPNVTMTSVKPLTVHLNSVDTATVQGQVASTQVGDTVFGVGEAVMLNGVVDANVSRAVMYDDGTHGDVTAGDGRFTQSGVSANCCALLGVHTIRMLAEVEATDGLHHATVVEFKQLNVAA